MKSIISHSSFRPFGWCVVLLLISTQSWGQETKEIYCELTGTSDYSQMHITSNNGDWDKSSELEVKFEISLSKDSAGHEKIDFVKLHQEGIQTSMYIGKSEFSSKVEDREIHLNYFLNKDNPHPVSNIETRIYEIKAVINRYTGKVFLNGNLQGMVTLSNDKLYVVEFLKANGDCIQANESKF